MAVYTTIDDPTVYFRVKLFAGNGGTQSITFDETDTNMQPDLVWIKNREHANHHVFFDAVRGTSKVFYGNLTNAEATVTGVTAFDSNGFTLGNDSDTNRSSNSHIAWNWKESATAGFDMVGYTGTGSSADVSHSLSAVPEVIFTRRRENTQDWFVYTTATGATDALFLNKTNAEDTSQSNAYDALPTSSVINYGNDTGVNGSSNTYIAYLWRSVQGFSKFGQYIGNGADPDGPYVYLGFSPQLVIIKRTDSTDDWKMHTKKVEVHNPLNQSVKINSNVAEATETDHEIDFLSNGFKLRENNSAFNADGGTYVYMAWAESPFVNSNGIPNNAR